MNLAPLGYRGRTIDSKGIQRAIIATLLLGTLGACTGASVQAPVKFPVPVVESLPLNMGLVLSDELRSYVHQEKLENNGTWVIDIGDAQQPMFENLFSGLFQSYETLAKVNGQSSSHNGVIVPNIAQAQFSIPSQTRTDYFEVWIRYQIQLFDEQTLIAEWPITAYGKANVRNYGLVSTNEALTAAARAACRDAMAFFAVEFGADPKIRAWLDNEIPNLTTEKSTVSS